MYVGSSLQKEAFQLCHKLVSSAHTISARAGKRNLVFLSYCHTSNCRFGKKNILAQLVCMEDTLPWNILAENTQTKLFYCFVNGVSSVFLCMRAVFPLSCLRFTCSTDTVVGQAVSFSVVSCWPLNPRPLESAHQPTAFESRRVMEIQYACLVGLISQSHPNKDIKCVCLDTHTHKF